MNEDEPISLDGRWTPTALGLLRIVTALLYLEHGTSKMLGWPLTSASDPSPWSLFWVAGIIELVGSLMLLAGMFTRQVAFLLAGEMAIAYWIIHAPKSFYPVLNGGESAILFCFIFLLFAATGAGAWSVDEVMRRRHHPVERYHPAGI